MALAKMMAIEYNMWMSIIQLIKDAIKASTTIYDGDSVDSL